MSSGRYYRLPNGLQVAVPGKLSYWMFAELRLKLCLDHCGVNMLLYTSREAPEAVTHSRSQKSEEDACAWEENSI